LEGVGMEKVGIFHGHLEYITAIWYILCPFRDSPGCSLVYFPPFGILCHRNLATLKYTPTKGAWKRNLIGVVYPLRSLARYPWHEKFGKKYFSGKFFSDSHIAECHDCKTKCIVLFV
jgi:hypothetical protein